MQFLIQNLLMAVLCHTFRSCQVMATEKCFHPLEYPEEYGPCWGSLNYKGLEVPRQVETERKKYYLGGILPCTADLKWVAKTIVPFEEYQSEWGKGIKLCHARAVRLACDAYGVTEKAKNEGLPYLSR
jgi:hypothetical protein